MKMWVKREMGKDTSSYVDFHGLLLGNKMETFHSTKFERYLICSVCSPLFAFFGAHFEVIFMLNIFCGARRNSLIFDLKENYAKN